MKSFDAIPSVAREGETVPRPRRADFWSNPFRWPVFFLLLTMLPVFPCRAAPDLILYNGKVVSVDAAFSIHEAIAVTAFVCLMGVVIEFHNTLDGQCHLVAENEINVL